MDLPAEVITLDSHSLPPMCFSSHTKSVSAFVVCVRRLELPAIAVSVYSDEWEHVGMRMRPACGTG